LEAGEVFWDINFGKFWDYIVWKEFCIKIYMGIAIVSFRFRVLILVDVCWAGVCNVYVMHPVVFNVSFNKATVNQVETQHNTFALFTDWSLTLREERRLRVFENRVLRGIFGAKRDEVTGEWRKLHNEELNDMCCLPNIAPPVKWGRMRWAGHVARMEERRDIIWVLVEKPEGKRPLGRPRCRWDENIKMDLQEVGCGGVDWIDLSQNRDRM
jgi:hypothetical protein